MTGREASAFLSVLALFYVDPWIYGSEHYWRLPDEEYQRLAQLAGELRAVFPHC